MSVYNDGITPEGAAKAVNKLKLSFPQLNDGFHKILSQRVLELRISDQRFMDSVDHVIDNCIYPTPTIAQFISFDKTVVLYDYNQYLKLNDELQNQAGKYYKAVRIEGHDKPLYASDKDIVDYGLEAWKK